MKKSRMNCRLVIGRGAIGNSDSVELRRGWLGSYQGAGSGDSGLSDGRDGDEITLSKYSAISISS